MQTSFKNINPLYRFLISFGFLALIWYPLYYFVIQKYTSLDMLVIDTTLQTSKAILNTFGYTSFIEGRVLRIAGTSGLWVGDNCNAVALFALFSGFIISFPGNIKSKLWFIPAGIILVFIMNCLRMVFLAIIDTYSRAWTEFNHTYTFTILIYGFIFGLWMFWVNRYSYVKKNNEK